MSADIRPVPLEKAYRLINHGPTVLVSARHDGLDNVMAAAWACALDYDPPKMTVVLDRIAKTRQLVELSGRLVVQVPTVAQVDLTYQVGHMSLAEQPDKLARCGVELMNLDGRDMPFVSGCAAWLECRLIPEPQMQERHDLFVAEVVGAWADARVFADGHWHFAEAPDDLRSVHYIAGAHFYAIGEEHVATKRKHVNPAQEANVSPVD